jgi:hypothetical protein
VADQVKLKARLDALVGLAIKPLPRAERIVLDTADGLVVVSGRPRAAPAAARRRRRRTSRPASGVSMARSSRFPTRCAAPGSSVTRSLPA